jgi:hypothetical protein
MSNTLSGTYSFTGAVDIGDTLTLHNNSTTSATASLAVGGTGVLTVDTSGNELDIAATDVLKVLNTVDSSNVTSGAFQLLGGGSVVKNLHIGGGLYLPSAPHYPLGWTNIDILPYLRYDPANTIPAYGVIFNVADAELTSPNTFQNYGLLFDRCYSFQTLLPAYVSTDSQVVLQIAFVSDGTSQETATLQAGLGFRQSLDLIENELVMGWISSTSNPYTTDKMIKWQDLCQTVINTVAGKTLICGFVAQTVEPPVIHTYIVGANLRVQSTRVPGDLVF